MMTVSLNAPSGARLGPARPALALSSNRSRAVPVARGHVVRTQALFGWGKESEENKLRRQMKDEMWENQKEILRQRREGKTMEGVAERRAKAKVAQREKEEKKKRDRAMLAKGIRPPPDERFTKNKKGQYDGKDDPSIFGNIIIPMAPFGIPEFDNGERFDLKAPYTDEGWVDEEADAMGSFMSLFGGKKKKEEEKKSKKAPPKGDDEKPKKKKGWF